MARVDSAYHIGMDDTDSSDGMCTTFLTYKLVQRLLKLEKERIHFLDYPNLIRLNPNIPWKTRGNAALVLRIRADLSFDRLFEIAERLLRKYSKSSRANSGLVILNAEKVPSEIRDFSRRAMYSVLGLREARSLMEKFRARYLGLRSQQGLVGALAGIGNTLDGDFTYELIAYRKSTVFPRRIEKEKIIRMSRETNPQTFNNYDEQYDKIMIMPHGADPVLCGIRGETPSAVLGAFEMILPISNLQGWMIYRSNQGTGEHLANSLDLSNSKAYTSGFVRAKVSAFPRAEIGGHVFFRVENESGGVECACYEPTGEFRKAALSLTKGDYIEAGGGLRKPTSIHPQVLNLEYFIPLKLTKRIVYKNPKCIVCLSTMSSEGRGQGYQCPKCGYTARKAERERSELKRALIESKLYLPPIKAHRHLTKPVQRYGIKQKKTERALIENWTSF